MRPQRVLLLLGLAAAALIAGTVVAVLVNPQGLPLADRDGCGFRLGSEARALSPTGTQMEVDQDGDWRAVRTLTYEAPAAAEGEIFACTGTGRIELGVADQQGIVVEAKVIAQASTKEEAERLVLSRPPQVTAADTRLAAVGTRHEHWPFGNKASISLRIVVPRGMLVHADLSTGTGNVAVEGARLEGLEVSVGTGSVQIAPASASNQIDASTGTGSVEARFGVLHNASIDLSTGTGSIELQVPADAQHGYLLDAGTGSGRVQVDLPDMELDSNSRSAQGQTRDYERRAVQVRIDAGAGTGSITVEGTS